jgi:tetratricopeptide (TPR) repeat protein
MKVKIFLCSAIILIMASFTGTFAQSIDSVKYRDNLLVYSRAMKYNDMEVAKNALYNLIVMNPRSDSLLLSLSYLYFEHQNFISSILVSQDVLRLNPNNEAALELSAVGFENIGATDRALESYEAIYLKRNDINSLYKMAFLQYDVNKLNEAKTTAEILLERKEMDEATLIFNTEDGQQQQEIPMKASIYNLLGMISQKEGNKEQARGFFNKAIVAAPDFAIPKKNLQELANN